MDSAQDKPIDLKHYSRLVWRRRWTVLVCTLAVVCGAAIATTFIPDRYESEATLLIQERQPLTQELERVMGSRQSDGGFRRDEERMSQLVGRVRSRPFLERVVKILKMTDDPEVHEEAKKRLEDHPNLTEDELVIRILVARLQSRIRFASVGPGLYRIIVLGETAQNAQLLAKWISELFVDISIQKELEQIRKAREFGAEQLRVYQEQLKQSEQALERYQGSMIQQSMSGNPVQEGNLSDAENLERRLLDEETTAKARVQPLARAAEAAGMASYRDALLADKDVQGVADRITQALNRSVKDELVSKTPWAGWPPPGPVNVLRRDLHQVLEKRAAELETGKDEAAVEALVAYGFAQVDADIQSQVVQELQRNIGAFKHQAQMKPADTMELERLQEEVKKNRDLLNSFQAQMTASDVSQAVETTNLGLRIEIIDPAQVPLKSSRPSRLKIVIAALLVGPLIGIGFAFLGEILDPTLRTIEDIRKVAPEPIYGTIPLIDSIMPRTRGLRRYWVPATLGGIVLVTVLFFVARSTVFRDLQLDQPVQMVDPGEPTTP